MEDEQTKTPVETTKTINTPQPRIKKSSLKEKITNILMSIEDIATLEVMLPVDARVRDRIKSIQKQAQAEHRKINGKWKTYPPKLHIGQLSSTFHSRDEAIISFDVYETDEKGEKKLHEQKLPVTLDDGRVVEKSVNAEYRILYTVNEFITKNKPITREVEKYENDEN